MAPRHSSSIARRVGLGALLGLGAGILLVGVGIARIAVFLLGGGRLAAIDAGDVRALTFYVGGFGAGGALIGALRPLLHGKGGVYVGCMLAGIVVMLAIAVGDKGSLSALDGVDWVAMPLMGMVFGSAAAYGFTRNG
jgi:hypothetical protein